MARAALKQKKPEVVYAALTRHLPKGTLAPVEGLPAAEIEMLNRVRISKTVQPTRNERRKDRGIGPTPERLDRSGDSHVVGDDKQGHRTYTMQDSPLDRLWIAQQRSRARKAIQVPKLAPAAYTALQRYKHHWYHGGLQAGIGSADLNRVFASDPGSMSGMAKSEKQAHHRQQWRKAREELGHQPGIVVDNIVCAEWSLEIAGYSIGYASPYRAREAAREILCDAGRRLAKLWGIG